MSGRMRAALAFGSFVVGGAALMTCAINPQPEPPGSNDELGGAGGSGGMLDGSVGMDSSSGGAKSTGGFPGSGGVAGQDQGDATNGDIGVDSPGGSGLVLFSSALDQDPDGPTPDYEYDCRAGGTHTWAPNQGWMGGGAAKFTPTTAEGNSCGVANIGWAGHEPELIHVRFLFKPGPGLYASSVEDKLLIAHREPYSDETRFIGMLQGAGAVSGGPGYHLLLGRNIDLCPDPGVHAGFFIEDLGEQWVCLEYALDAANNAIQLWVTSEDHSFDQKLVMESSPTEPTGSIWNTRAAPPAYEDGACTLPSWGAGTWSGIPLIGGFWNGGATASPDLYLLIDEVVVADGPIGPPTGF